MAEATGHSNTATGAEIAPIAPVLFKARGRGKARANMRKRSPSPPPARDSDSDDGSDSDSASDARHGSSTMRDAKRRRRNGAGVIGASTEAGGAATAATGRAAWEQPEFVTDRKTLLADSDVATKQSHMYDDAAASGSGGKNARKGQVLGAAAALGSALGGPAPRSVGPVKAAATVRTITITDFSPDVCKDYKQTGFCGFGDGCKFLHAREDYKQGWQLDNEWEAVTKGKKNLGGTIVASAAKKHGGRGKRDREEEADVDDDDDEDEAMLLAIPFACVICRQSYKQPIVTRCGHYFCERCALDRYRRDPSCAACGAATTGVFNTAKRLAKLLERKRQRAAKRRSAALAAGEDVSSEGEEADGA